MADLCYLVGGFDNTTSKLVIERWITAATPAAAKTAAIALTDFIGLGINNTTYCRILDVINPNDYADTIARDVARESTQVTVKSSIDTLSAKIPSAAALSDALANPTAAILAAANLLFDGTQFVRARGNLDKTIVASGAYTTTQTSSDQTNHNARGLIVTIDTTLVPGSAPSNVITIDGKDPLSGKYYNLITSAAITGTGTVILRIYPGLTAITNLTVSDVLPHIYRIKSTAGNANSATYSINVTEII